MDTIEVLRRFNRVSTRHIGVLDESYLGTGRSIGASRLLFEVAPEGTEVASLRRRLGLDSGYLSRLLRELENDGLVEVRRATGDGRRRVVCPTPSGRGEQRRLDERSERRVATIVEPLSDRQRAELATAVETARRLLVAATVTFDVVDPASDDARSAIDRYFAELDERFPTGFDPSAGGARGDLDAYRAPGGAFVVIRDDDVVVGCGAVQRLGDRVGEIKRMWIDDDWRGLGLGRRLLVHLEGVARDLGHSRVSLDTNETLTEALTMYERAGYERIDRYNDNPYAHHWFTKLLAGPAS